MRMVEASNVDGVLCLGTPRLFEELKLKKDKRIFMLDIDRRYVSLLFHLKLNQFRPISTYRRSTHNTACSFITFTTIKLQRDLETFSLYVFHFYLYLFLQKCSSVLLVCDPPFGLVMEPLMNSLLKLEKMHQQARFLQLICSILYPI